MSERHQREKGLFLAARELPPDERSDFVTEQAGADEDLAERVLDLLAHDDARGPLDAGPEATGQVRGRDAGARPGASEAAGAGARALVVGPRQALPTDLLAAGVERLRVVALFPPIALVALWLVPVAVAGKLGQEFSELQQWLPPTSAIVASLVMLWLIRKSEDPERTLRAGSIYQVVVAYALVSTQYWGTFRGLPVEIVRSDLVGISSVALWMVLFSVIVPARPKRALPPLLLSASAPAVTYLMLIRWDDAPPLGPDRFFYSMVLPYVATVAFCYLGVRIVYQLGREVSRAREVGSYTLESRLGRGGMGEVWRARHRLLARPAAVKLVRSDVLGSDPAFVERALRRFEREAQVTAGLRSPHTVELYDFGVAADGSLYYVMELLEGIDLERLVRRFGPLSPERTAWLARQACLSLEEAHGAGLVHRDIKPANLFVCRLGVEADVLKVLDFGLVRGPGEGGRAGGLEGTPGFIAPEQLEHGRVPDARADVYALGAVMYWSLTGELVEASGPEDASAQRVPGLEAIVRRCLAADPDARFDSAAEVGAALDALQLADPWTARRAAAWWQRHGAAALA